MTEPLLTISIPTFNRASYLDTCLQAIFSQLGEEYIDEVEVFISNNASPDNTAEIIEKYKSFPVTFINHKESIGGDNNLAYCFQMAKGKYAWVFGDDDFLFPGTLSRIISILRNNDIGVLYLNNLWYNQVEDVQIHNFIELKYTTYNEPLVFLDRVNYWTTFITSNIVNKKALEVSDWLNKFEGTNFRQLAWTIPAIFKSKQNIFIEDQVLACKANNTGGYALFRVFGKDINKVLDYYVAQGYDKRLKEIMNNNLLVNFFPSFIKNSTDRFLQENYVKVLFPVFWKYKAFWKNIVPLWLKSYKRKLWFLFPIPFIKKVFSYFLFKIIDSDEYKKRVAYRYPQMHQGEEQIKKLKSIGPNYSLPPERIIMNPQYISIGENFAALKNLRIEAWDAYAGEIFYPEIVIGNNVILNTDVHIGCINRIVVGNNVLMASRIYITDHSHGEINEKALELAPTFRPLVSRGPVYIEDNVWIGEGACIMPGVTIGKNSIIGANAVVSKSIPPNCVAAGVPAKVIKQLIA